MTIDCNHKYKIIEKIIYMNTSYFLKRDIFHRVYITCCKNCGDLNITDTFLGSLYVIKELKDEK